MLRQALSKESQRYGELLCALANSRNIWQFGDFQTPNSLAQAACQILVRSGIAPLTVLEPTCGIGGFVEAAANAFPDAHVIGADINDLHLNHARNRLNAQITKGRVEFRESDFFKTDWIALLESRPRPWLILGNPPWVTSAELGTLQSSNLPVKSNFDGLAGLDAITGKSNFDISEWMHSRYLDWLSDKGGSIAVLIKTAVARKILVRAWKSDYPLKSAEIYPIDAMKEFGASVDACFFVAHVLPGEYSTHCDVYSGLENQEPSHTFGFQDGALVAKVDAFVKWQHLAGAERHYFWRSGIKHDCSRVMELRNENGHFRNGQGEIVSIEKNFLYPMLKSSDVNKPRGTRDLLMLVTQQKVGDDTRYIEQIAPQTWEYLQRHADILGRRASAIYRKRPPFSIFGVGDYSFAPWKVVISGFYKSLRFVAIGPVEGKPTVIDDTIYSLPCRSSEEAEFLCELLNSEPAQEFYGSMVFWSDKRPITSELLRRLNIEKLAVELGRLGEYVHFTQSDRDTLNQQLSLHL